MKNVLYLNLKAFFVLRMFKFLSWLFDNKEKQGKIRLSSKFMISQPG